eukprot:13959608-Alexandrium_andersonii.AAC.1
METQEAAQRSEFMRPLALAHCRINQLLLAGVKVLQQTKSSVDIRIQIAQVSSELGAVTK